MTASQIARAFISRGLVVLLALLTSLGAMSRAAAEDDPAVRTAPLLLPGYSQIRHTWAVVQALLDKEDFAEALVQIEHVYDAQLDSGVRNLFAPAIVVVRAARRATDSGNTAVAARLAQAAQRIAPDLPVARFSLAHVYFEQDRLAVGPVFSETTGGLSRLAVYLPERMRLTANSVGTALLTFFVVAFVFAAMLLARSFRLLAHDLLHVFPRGINNVQAAFFTALLLVFPFAFGVGAVYLVLFWLFAVWTYTSRVEKALSVLFILGIGAAPFASDLAVQSARYFGGSDDAVFTCAYGLCGPSERDRLRAASDPLEGEPDPLARLALGNHLRRIATSDASAAPEARAHLEKALSESPGDPVTLTSLANLSTLEAVNSCRRGAAVPSEQKFQEADDHYAAALAADPDYLPALYNRSILKRRANEVDEADALYARAQQQDADALYRFEKEVSRSVPVDRCPAGFNANRQLMDPGIPAALVVKRALHPELSLAGGPLFVPFSGLLIGKLGRGSMPVLAGVTLLAIFVLTLLYRALRHSSYCAHCGKVACEKCKEELADLDICDACLYFRIKGSFVDPKDLWFRERRIQSNESTRRRVMRGLTFLLPGAGHLYRGKTLRGTVYLLIFVACVLAMVFSRGVIADPTPVPPAWPWLPLAGFGATAALLYVVALVDIYSIRSSR